MRIALILMLVAALINLVGCSSVRGNVVPKSGPTMEQVYDGDGNYDSVYSNNNSVPRRENINRRQVNHSRMQSSSLAENVSANSVTKEFRKVTNPELKMYIFPHLAGQDEIPVPGYYTAFNVYDRDYYALANE